MQTIIDAALALGRAGQWDLGLRLLETAAPLPGGDIAAAAVAVDRDFWTGRADASPLVADLPPCWEADVVRLQADYGIRMRRRIETGMPVDARDLLVVAVSLAERAASPASAASPRLYAGLSLDVLQGDAEGGRPHYEYAAAHGDDYVTAYALRHLGALAHASGDHATAGDLWRRSLTLRQRCGHLTGALAQLLLVDTAESANNLVHMWGASLSAPALCAMAGAALTRSSGSCRMSPIARFPHRQD